MAATSFKFDAHSPASEKFKKAVFEWIKTAWDSSLEDDAVAQYAVALVARGTEPRKLTDSLTSVLGSTTASDLCEMLIKYTRLHRDELQLSKSAVKLESKKKTEDSSKVSKTPKPEGSPAAQVSKAPEQMKALKQPESSSTPAVAAVAAATTAAATVKPSPAKAAPASQIKAAAPAKSQVAPAPAAPAKPSTAKAPAAPAKPQVSKPIIVHEQQVDDLLDEDVSGEELVELEEDEGAEKPVTDNEEPRTKAQGLAGASRHKKLEWNDPMPNKASAVAGDRRKLHGRLSQREEQPKDRSLVSAQRHDQVEEPTRSKDRAPLLVGQRPSERHPTRIAAEEIRQQSRLKDSHVEIKSRDGRRSEPSSHNDHRASKSASPPRVVSPRVRVRSSAVVPGQEPKVSQRKRFPMTLFGKALTGLGEDRKLSAKATSTSLKRESGPLAKTVGSKHQQKEIHNPASAAVRRISEREPEERPEKRRALSPDPDLYSVNGVLPGPSENPSLKKQSVFERIRSTNVDTLKRAGDELDTSSPSKQLRLGREMGGEMISGKGLGRGQGPGPGPREPTGGRGPGPGPRNNPAAPGMVSIVVVPNAIKAQPQVPKIVAAVAPSRTPMPGAVPMQKPYPAAAAAALPTGQSEDAIRAEALAIQAKIAKMKAQIEKLTQSADSRTIVVHNVHAQTSEAELKDHFRACGTISRTTILKDKPGLAHIEFSSEPGAKAAIGLSKTLLKGKMIIVQPKTQAPPTGGGSTIPVILKS